MNVNTFQVLTSTFLTLKGLTKNHLMLDQLKHIGHASSRMNIYNYKLIPFCICAWKPRYLYEFSLFTKL